MNYNQITRSQDFNSIRKSYAGKAANGNEWLYRAVAGVAIKGAILLTKPEMVTCLDLASGKTSTTKAPSKAARIS